ncbi:Small-conductance mechanosensitive channel [Shimia gijangensis]|uniref:Small-conductance mechanosensitive channel n=1 Tax=Shimia gijangensis TaxID=1470563 RepID=A0A1M6EQM5_9RHOB|nr:mechanosensitive ion channel family protein [Shimia gijangensis]SHI87570.1 Small-conductance mechanosensitive channel [Shimia gijangensis]
MLRILRTIAFSTLLSVFIAPLALAQSVAALTGSGSTDETAPVITPEDMTPEAIDAMVARMSDDQVRALLLERLDSVAAKADDVAPKATLGQRVTNLWNAFISPPIEVVQKFPRLIEMERLAFGNLLGHTGGFGGLLVLLGLIALVLVIGFAAEYIVRTFLARRVRQNADLSGEQTLRDALGFLMRRFLREIFGLVVFYIALRIAGRAILSPAMLTFAAPLVTYLIWMPRLAAAMSRFMLAPHRPDLRLVTIDDHWARFLHRNLVGLVFLAGFTMYIVGFNAAMGVPPGATRLGYMLDTMVYVFVAVIALTAREGLQAMMLGSDPDPTSFDQRVAHGYPYFAVAVAAGTWVLVTILLGMGKVDALLNGAHYYTMGLLLAMPIIDTAIRGVVRHVVPPMQGEGPVAEAAYKETKRSFVRIGRVIAAGVVLLLIAHAWDTNYLELFRQQAGIADNLFSFAMTCVFGYIAYEAASLWINRRLAAEQTALGLSQEDADAEMGGASGSRLSTVLPLMLLTARSAIIVVFGLLAIGNLGIDITPLLAGAGVIGLAIGFGAQKLVTDVVSGVFFLIDDAFRVGEYVEMDGTMGAVEKISIRSMQLRHHRGPVHTIPYGEIPKLTNYSRDWVIMKLKFTVPFDTDPNKVKKIFKKIGQDMLVDPLFADDFLQPFKSQGVFDIDDVGMVIRGKFMAKPGKQFMIRKEIYNKVKAAFAEAGIDFARREVRVAIPGLEHHDEMTDEEKAQVAAAGAAAAAASQQTEEVPGSGEGSKPGD